MPSSRLEACKRARQFAIAGDNQARVGEAIRYAMQGLQGVDDAFLLDDPADHAQQQDIWRQSQFRHQFRARGAERVFGYPAIFHAIAHHLQLVRLARLQSQY